MLGSIIHQKIKKYKKVQKSIKSIKKYEKSVDIFYKVCYNGINNQNRDCSTAYRWRWWNKMNGGIYPIIYE